MKDKARTAQRREGVVRGAPISNPRGLLWWQRRLFEPVDAGSLMVFRIVFGLLMLWEVYRYAAMGRIRRYFMEPTVFFSYFGFDSVKPWPGDGMFIHFAVMGLLAAFITVGLFYRLSMVLFFLAFTFVFLLDQSLYLNHFYLICLISFLMIFVPANRAVALDARWGMAQRSFKVSMGWVWLLRAQIGLVYFFGGVAKLNADWLRGEPIRDWLASRSSMPLLGPVLAQEWTVWFFAYGGMLFDLLIVPALLWRRTRVAAFAVAVIFHLTNALVFNIGIFPWFMIAATTLFFRPDWPHRWLKNLRGTGHRPELPASTGAHRSAPAPARVSRAAVVLWTLYFVVQLLVPLRHWLYGGDASWTEEGHRFSWRMKLRAKSAEVQFFVTDPATGQTLQVNPESQLKPHQVDEMVARPDMILQFAHHLAAEARQRGAGAPEVRAFVSASLNGRAPQLLIDPSVNLAQVRRGLGAAAWIRPLREPLRRETGK